MKKLIRSLMLQLRVTRQLYDQTGDKELLPIYSKLTETLFKLFSK